jgi:hypothetical protein
MVPFEDRCQSLGICRMTDKAEEKCLPKFPPSVHVALYRKFTDGGQGHKSVWMLTISLFEW